VSIGVKICGLSDVAAIDAAVCSGARYAGFVFYPKSPRFVVAQHAAALIARLSTNVTPVGLFVNASPDDIAAVVRDVPLRMIQLHGTEKPEHVAQVQAATGLPVIKAVGVASAKDIIGAQSYEAIADYLLFDATPIPGGLPGGNSTAFDWSLLKNICLTKPWFLAGGLDPANVADAIAATSARLVDVSSGVEDAVGHKNPAKIKAFIEASQK
jgi:phosphoribosylanthranilate isomerase